MDIQVMHAYIHTCVCIYNIYVYADVHIYLCIKDLYKQMYVHTCMYKSQMRGKESNRYKIQIDLLC